MTYREPLLILKRLIVFCQSKRVYDEVYYEGVNIIRGTNSTGKSTIVDFISFALGADINQWKPEASRCDYIVAEIEANNQILTTRRTVSSQKHRPMEIYWGPAEEALARPWTTWSAYPYARSEGKESFSQVLFRALSVPEVPSDYSSNITMHQLLRLLCVDQLSGVLSLFKDEQFDSPLTRQTVANLLLGVFDNNLYANELQIRELRKSYEALNIEYGSLKRVLSETGQLQDVVDVEATIIEAESRYKNVQDQIKLSSTSYQFVGDHDASTQLQKLGEEVKVQRAVRTESESKVQNLEFEQIDSEKFIENLIKRLNALDESVSTETALGSIRIRFCPECLAPLDESAVQEGHCFVCKGSADTDGRTKRLSQMRQELSAQIKESSDLLVQKNEVLSEKRRQLQALQRAGRLLESRFQDAVQRVQSNRDEQLDQLLIERGALESTISSLQMRMAIAGKVRDLRARVSSSQLEIEKLRIAIKDAQASQSERLLLADKAISDSALYLLHNDLPREEQFMVANEVKADFERNICSVDKLISFSASSVTYLKSSVHYAILFASLKLNFFRYPKFILNDDMEDKGMEEIRSQNFQKLIVRLSQKSTVKHQIIFTTSMIAKELDDTTLCVGPSYSRQRRSLAF